MALSTVAPTPRMGAEIEIDQASLPSGEGAEVNRELLELREVVFTRNKDFCG